MNRIDQKQAALSKAGKKALVVYITAGYPTISLTEELVLSLEKNGADMIELGMPFSDPVADGPTIQHSSAIALKKGMTLKKFFILVRSLRRKTQVPLIMMGYYNPILAFGINNFVSQAALCGLDGVIVPDLPPEEATQLNKALKKKNISQIFLISPVTDGERIKKISRASSGFIYYVSLTGVTGARQALPEELAGKLKIVKSCSKKPVYAGFGISTPKQVKQITRTADGVIIGSALIKVIEKHKGSRMVLKKAGEYVRGLNALTY